MASFKTGDRVVKSPYWKPNDLDEWGRGEGIGEVFKLLPDTYKIAVLWPNCITEEPYPWLVHEEEKDYLHMTEIQCISCNFIIRKLGYEKNSPPTSAMWDGGVIFKEGAGYGSMLDGDIYLIAVCDECLKKKGMKIGNYM